MFVSKNTDLPFNSSLSVKQSCFFSAIIPLCFDPTMIFQPFSRGI